MKIGFDFDNTIVDYSEIFEVAKLNSFIQKILKVKTSIKDYLHKKIRKRTSQ